MKKFLAFFLCAATLVEFASCSDDEDESIDAALLVGTWKETAQYDGEYDKWSSTNLSPYPLRLNADGTGSDQDTFTWTCSGNTLIIKYDYDEFVSEANIDLLTETELVISGSYYGEDGRKYTDKKQYERIN